MTTLLKNYVADRWVATSGTPQPLVSAITGEVVAQAGAEGLDFAGMLDHARRVGGPALRAMTFHERALMVKALGQAILERKDELYALNWATGATRQDGWIDIEGGAGTLFTTSSKARRELPNDVVIPDGDMEPIGRHGSFVGQHVYTSLQGAAVHINAFNFPVWGMLEKLGPTLIAGLPAIVKPASPGAYLAEAAVRIMLDAGVLPPGALQLIVGHPGDLLDHLTCQDVVSFTGSAATAMKLQAHPAIAREGVRFIAERDSLNASILGPDATPDSPEFTLFVKEVVREMTVKAGQKCTAIRRALVPAALLDAAEAAIAARLSKVVVGDPQAEGVTMGALATAAQAQEVRARAREMTVKAGQKCTAIRRALVPAALLDAAEAAIAARLAKVVVGDPQAEGVTMGALATAAQATEVRARAREMATEARLAFGDIDHVEVRGTSDTDAFVSPLLFRSDDPWSARLVHDVEAFGPVSTLMPYRDIDDAIALANRGKGSLVVSFFGHDPDATRAFVLGAGAYHGRIVVIDRDSAGESTGHGSPLPMLIHGGPGRAGGGEEMGGVRGIKHYMQRSALQGSPRQLSAVIGRWLPGAPQPEATTHPFRLAMRDLPIGYTLHTQPRTITLEDIEQFAHFTGDTFYAHMDEEAAARSPIFGGRVAHGYLILSFAAGLFVDPDEGPVLANTGLDRLRFVKPVKPGDTVQVALTVKAKTLRTPEQGEVRWDVAVTNQDGDLVATYELMTMNQA